ncbi:hypothetical protein [Hydrocarboniphaga effusa]|uniref:hypothetical protein n=1 Tax=Hydrocarboniphaga effusa TaxID=243629 RepID=UPI00398BE7BE
MVDLLLQVLGENFESGRLLGVVQLLRDRVANLLHGANACRLGHHGGELQAQMLGHHEPRMQQGELAIELSDSVRQRLQIGSQPLFQRCLLRAFHSIPRHARSLQAHRPSLAPRGLSLSMSLSDESSLTRRTCAPYGE